jgi:hypothetical protein
MFNRLKYLRFLDEYKIAQTDKPKNGNGVKNGTKK